MDLHVLTRSCPTLRATDLPRVQRGRARRDLPPSAGAGRCRTALARRWPCPTVSRLAGRTSRVRARASRRQRRPERPSCTRDRQRDGPCQRGGARDVRRSRSEEHTSELQSLMRISYAVFCLKKKIYIPVSLQFISISSINYC